MTQARAKKCPGDIAGVSVPQLGLAKDDSEDMTLMDALPGILELWLPIMIALSFTYATDFVNTIVIGSLDDPLALAGVGLGNFVQNCFGMSLTMGIAAAMDVLVSQAHGAGEIELTGHYLQRCRALVLLNMLWLYPLLYFSGTVLTALTYNPGAAQHAGEYNRASLCGIVAWFQFWVVRQYLQNRRDVVAAMAITFITTLLHPIWCIYFVWGCQLGNAGAGYANSVTWWLQYLLVAVYVKRNSATLGLSTWTLLGIKGSGFRGLWSYMEICIPTLLQSVSEVWFWEIAAAIVAFVGADVLAAQVCIVSLVLIVQTPSVAISFTGATLVGSAIGAGSPTRVRKTVCAALALNFCLCIVVGLCVWLGKSWISKMYTPQEEVDYLMQTVLPIFALANFWDTAQHVMGGLVRGMGRPTFAAMVTAGMYYAIDLPVLVILTVLGQSLPMMWMGLMGGSLVATYVYGFSLLRTDYEALVQQAPLSPSGRRRA